MSEGPFLTEDVAQSLAREIVGPTNQRDLSLRQAVCQTNAVNDSTVIRFPGSTTDVAGVKGLLSNVRPGATVWVLQNGPDLFILGVVDSGWIHATYVNAWGDYGNIYGGAYYRRMGNVVHLTGLVNSAGVNYVGNASIFILPAGFRPVIAFLTAQAAAGGVMRVDTLTDGTVMTNGAVIGTTNTQTGVGWVSLAGISFPADG